MFIYEIRTGKIYREGGDELGQGYSGKGPGLNNPNMTDIEDVGPIPVGMYTIGPAHTHPHLGPVTMNLLPLDPEQMLGREDFRIHGDNGKGNHSASEGCIIQGRAVREAIDADGDRRLQVVDSL